MKFIVFIDYDNLSHLQKETGILDIVTKALVQTPLDGVSTRTSCDVRIYGGWYEGTQITRLAEKVTIEIQEDFPKVIRLHAPSGDRIFISTNAELAVALLQEPGHHLFNTYRRKGKPTNVRVANPSIIGCMRSDCILPKVKSILSKGRCPIDGCSVAEDNLIYRHEQKIVDTMLSCDLVHAATGVSDRVILISGDDDFLPPLRAVLLSGVEAIRFHPKPSRHRVAFPQGGARLLEMEL